jgi:hypothetical protein
MSNAITSNSSSSQISLQPSDSKDPAPWKVLEYEVAMYFEMRRMLADSATRVTDVKGTKLLVHSGRYRPINQESSHAR